MKRPTSTETVQILSNSGELVSASIEVPLEMGPKGKVEFGPVDRCPITGEVLYRTQMSMYRGTYYSERGLQEVIERDRKRNY